MQGEKLKMENNTYTNKISTSDINEHYCTHRLPCGVCEKTNQICPLAQQTITIAWGN